MIRAILTSGSMRSLRQTPGQIVCSQTRTYLVSPTPIQDRVDMNKRIVFDSRHPIQDRVDMNKRIVFDSHDEVRRKAEEKSMLAKLLGLGARVDRLTSIDVANAGEPVLLTDT